MGKDKVTAPTALAVDSDVNDNFLIPRAELTIPNFSTDLATGEEYDVELLRLLAGDLDSTGAKWRSISVHGFFAPLRGNRLLGVISEIREIESKFKGADGKTKIQQVCTVEGVASIFQGDGKRAPNDFTKSKTDPDWNPAHWATQAGCWFLGLQAGSQRLISMINVPVSIQFGPYVGENRRKHMQVAVPTEESREQVIALMRKHGLVS